MTNPGKQLAALRRTETKNCADCGTEFTGLIKRTLCKKCTKKHQKRKERANKMENLKKLLIEKLKSSTEPDADLNSFMIDNFGNGWYEPKKHTKAMEFYENIGCQCRTEAECELEMRLQN